MDATWVSGFPRTGIGVLCRDSGGSLKGAFAKFLDMDFESPMAELKAILEGVKFAEILGCQYIMLESDCLEAINLIVKEDEVRNELGVVVEEIRNRVLAFSEISFSFISRRHNSVADVVAKWAKGEGMNEV